MHRAPLCAALAVFMVCLASPTSARDFELTPFLGASFASAEYNGAAASYGLAFGIPLNENQALDLSFSRQETEARVVDPTYAEPPYRTEAGIDRLHFSGEYRSGYSDKPSRGFVSFGMGFARIHAAGDFGNSVSFSLAAGGGVLLRAGPRTRVRLQASWISTNAGGGRVTCTTGSCRFIAESFVGGIELAAGFTFRL